MRFKFIYLKKKGSKKNLSMFSKQKLINDINGQQDLTCFPNDNTKPIDYVIVYKKNNLDDLKKKKNQNAERIRELFFEKLKKESFDLYFINFEDAKSHEYCYVLLSCSTNRLLEEYGFLNYEMQLKNVNYNI